MGALLFVVAIVFLRQHPRGDTPRTVIEYPSALK